jgi:hypothetical protein
METGDIETEVMGIPHEELESLEQPFGLTLERDLYFEQKPLNECLE